MAVTLNASLSTGLIQSADTSGQINLQSNGTTVLGVTSSGSTVTGTQSVSGDLSFNSGYGSAAVAYGCRAWVNFNGTGTVAIRASGNVSSITDNATGNYSINFTNSMPDANYGAHVSIKLTTDTNTVAQINVTTSSFVNVVLSNPTIANYDSAIVCVSVFR
jgi:hypothetical protein